MQKPILKTLMAMALVIAALAPTALQAQSYGRFVLRITDADGNPLPGVKVTATCEELPEFRMETTTKRKGQATLAFADATKIYRLRIEKEGYTTLEMPAQAELRTTTERDIVMQAKGREVAPSREDTTRRFTPAEKEYNAGVEMLHAGDVEGAKGKFYAALEKDSTLAAAHAALAAVFLEQKSYDEAIAEANAFLDLAPDHPTGYQTLYQAYREKGETAKAQEALDKMASLEGASAESAVLLYNEGVEALRAEDLSTARARFEASLVADPTLAPAMLGLAKVHLTLDEFEAAATRAEQILAQEPEHYAALLASYEAHTELGNSEKAEEAFSRLAASHANEAGKLFYDNGVELFNAGMGSEAIKQFERALAANPELARAHYHLGLACINAGDSAKAKHHLGQFVAMAPEDPDVGSANEMLKYLGN